MAKPIISGAAIYNGKRMRRGSNRAALIAAGTEIRALGFRVAENRAFPPLDPNAHGTPYGGGWHYSDDGYGAIDTNWIHEGANGTTERMLIDLYVIPILRKHGIDGILWRPRRRSDHMTWCHADQGTYNDWTLRSYSASQKAYAAKLIAKYRTGAVGSTAQQAAVSSGKQAVVVDGLLGPATIKALQKALGVTVDGDLGPNSVKALQRWLNGHHKTWSLAVDGSLGPDTISAWQRHYGNNRPDGKISEPSILISAVQRDLNRGGIK